MKKIIASIMTMSILLSGISVINAETEEAGKELKLGDYVQLGEYYDEPIIWRCMFFGKTEEKENSEVPLVSGYRKESNQNYLPLLFSDKILCLKAYDAEASGEGGDSSHSRRKGGKASNYWADSNIRSWLNSDADAGEVEWLCSNPPTADSVWGGYNAYDQEAGFLTNFTDSELGLIQEVSQKSYVEFPEYNNGIYSEKEEEKFNMGYTAGGSEGYSYWEFVSDKVFLLSSEQIFYIRQTYELGIDYEEGVLSEKCAANSESAGSLSAGQDWEYWLKDPSSDTANNVKMVKNNRLTSNNANNSCIGVRPALYIKPDSKIISGDGTKENPYILSAENETETNAVSTPEPVQTAAPKPTLEPTPEPAQTPAANKENTAFKTSDWAKKPVEEAYMNGIIPEGLVNADLTSAISREEFAAIAVKLYEKIAQGSLINEEDEEFVYENSFTDISFSDYLGDILKAYHYGIVSGISETKFAPKTQITREQMAVMLYRAYTKAQPDNADISADYTNLFADDAQISQYAREAVYYMANKNIINGVGDNTFAPNGQNGTATREQAVAIALKCFKNNS